MTPDGEVVWEYVNPYFVQTPPVPIFALNAVFRAYRYTAEEIARANERIASLEPSAAPALSGD